MTQKSIIWLIAGAALAFIGFLFSDEEKYPVASKFSAFMIVIGVAVAAFSIAPKWNPISLI